MPSEKSGPWVPSRTTAPQSRDAQADDLEPKVADGRGRIAAAGPRWGCTLEKEGELAEEGANARAPTGANGQ